MVSGMASGRCLWKYKETYLSIRHQSKPVVSRRDVCSVDEVKRSTKTEWKQRTVESVALLSKKCKRGYSK